MRSVRNIERRVSAQFPVLHPTIVLMLLFTSVGFAGTINVPADQPTLTAAVAAAADSDVIILADGTYNSETPPIDVNVNNLTIKAAPGASVTITHPGAPNTKFIRVYGTPFTLQGDSPTNKMTLNYDDGYLVLEINNGGALVENVVISGNAGVVGQLFVAGTAPNDCIFNDVVLAAAGPNAGWLQGDINVTFNRLEYQYHGGLTFSNMGSGILTFNDSNFVGPPSYPPIAGRTAGAIVIANNCTFDWQNSIIDQAAPGGAAGCTITLNNPKIINEFSSDPWSNGGVPFRVNNGATVNINGNGPSDKLDNGVIGGRAFCQVTNGTLNVTDAVLRDGLETGDGNLENPANINLNRCILHSPPAGTMAGIVYHVGSVFGIDWGGAGKLTLNATNCIFNMNQTWGIMTDKKTNDEINLVHCTLFPNSSMAGGWMLTSGHADSDVINANYTIFDGMFEATSVAINSWLPLNGTLNLINPGAANFTSTPEDTITGDPLLTSDGRLPTDIESPAQDVAAGTSITIDIDGQTRPQNSIADLGADEVKNSGASEVKTWHLY